MARITSILRCTIVLLIADGTMVNFRVLARAMSTVAKSFETHQVVPDVIPKAPAALLNVSTCLLPLCDTVVGTCTSRVNTREMHTVVLRKNAVVIFLYYVDITVIFVTPSTKPKNACGT